MGKVLAAGLSKNDREEATRLVLELTKAMLVIDLRYSVGKLNLPNAKNEAQDAIDKFLGGYGQFAERLLMNIAIADVVAEGLCP